MTSALQSLVRAGRVSDALKICQDRSGVASVEKRVTHAELLYLTGDLEGAERMAALLERAVSEMSGAQHARAVLVRTCCRYDIGDFDSALDLNRKTLLLADRAQDVSTCAIAASLLLERAPGAKWRESVPLASQARRYAMKAGDPQITARVHQSFGRLEGRVSNFHTALRHFAIANSVLRSDWNLWIGAAITMDHASVVGLMGDFSAAVDLASRAASEAAVSGWNRGLAVAAANLAYFNVMLGREEDALEWIRRTPRRLLERPAHQLAIAETLAQAEFCRGDFTRAEELLDRAEFGAYPNLRWYDLSCHVTRTHIALAKHSWSDAKRWSESGLILAREQQNTASLGELMLGRAEATVQSGEALDSADIEVVAGYSSSAPLLGTACIVRGKALLNLEPSTVGISQSTVGISHLMRGIRILESVGSAPSRIRAKLARDGVPRIASEESPSLDSAVALLELAGYPHILGTEAFALVTGAGCVEAAALLAAGPAGTRVVDTAGWTEAEARAAAETPDTGVEHLPLGARGEDTWTLLVRPRRDLEPYCTFTAIRRLLAIAVALDGYRRDEQQRAALWPADSLDADPDCIWASEQMIETLTVARRIAPSPLSVLITGETGTGKEMLARAIHRASERAERPFLPFNCTAVPRDMLESQLFGFRKGAFTGADTAFPGVIRSAAGGTLFLDEIAEIGPDLQPKLLRFLEAHEIHPLGEPHPINVDVRVIAATNASVEQLVADGRFREDLFYRLNVIRLSLPPLRERREEIPPLVQHYLRRHGDEQRKGRLTVSDETLEYLLLFSWPGNVRQLANEIRRMVALAEPDAAITPALLSPEIQASRRTIPASAAPDAEARVALDQPLPAAVDLLEQMMIRRALTRTQGRVDEAARLLGISRKGLFLKRRRWGLSPAS